MWYRIQGAVQCHELSVKCLSIGISKFVHIAPPNAYTPTVHDNRSELEKHRVVTASAREAWGAARNVASQATAAAEKERNEAEEAVRASR